MPPDDPHTSFSPFYLVLFSHQLFLSNELPLALNFTIIFFSFLALQSSHDTGGIRKALSQILALTVLSY